MKFRFATILALTTVLVPIASRAAAPASQAPIAKETPWTKQDLESTVHKELSQQPLTATVVFQNVHVADGKVTGSVNIHWEEQILGTRVVLIDNTADFSTSSTQEIYRQSIGIGWGVSIDVTGTVRVTQNQVCLDLRANWPGGNVGKIQCQAF